MKKFIAEINSHFEELIILWPVSAIGFKLRSILYSKKLKRLGANANIQNGVRISGCVTIEIGDNCILGRNVNLNAGNCHGMFIGNDVSIAEGTYVRTANHNISDLNTPIKYQGHTAAELSYNETIFSIIIEDDVWVGAHAIILSGSKIGKGSVISAGAVVSNEIPPYSIVAGNPARVISNRLKKFRSQ